MTVQMHALNFYLNQAAAYKQGLSYTERIATIDALASLVRTPSLLISNLA